MGYVRVIGLSVLFTINITIFSGCVEPQGCTPSTDGCSCESNFDDCFDVTCSDEAEKCDSNEDCYRLLNCLEACEGKTNHDECLENCDDLYGDDGEDDLEALEDCSKFHCGRCPDMK